MYAFRERTWRIFRLVRAATHCEFRTLLEQTLLVVDVDNYRVLLVNFADIIVFIIVCLEVEV